MSHNNVKPLEITLAISLPLFPSDVNGSEVEYLLVAYAILQNPSSSLKQIVYARY